ncbi:MAG: endonuclease/exonuclease/phosphatase family protein [Deltaproteobacteria bacterium]|nr:endonuclease/exonuclease/phosphatase family protein [Deltaproteobacteria bacterium]MBN2674364.1 endonuclease/exonuclease/phosphatase family protein [Deltaproteobacteria bacterium]
MHFQFFTIVSVGGNKNAVHAGTIRIVGFCLFAFHTAWSFSCSGTEPVTSDVTTSVNTPKETGNTKDSFSVMSFNVLHPNRKDDEAGRGWDVRRDLVVKQISAYRPDILLLQEVVSSDAEHTAEWLRERLAKEHSNIRYAVVAGAGDEPKDILVNTRVFEVVFPKKMAGAEAYDVYGEGVLQTAGNPHSMLNSFYLPPDPATICSSEVNRSEPMSNRKNASFALLRHRTTQQELVVANVHLLWQFDWKQAAPIDNDLRVAQLKCVSDVLHRRFGKTPKLIGGDFNSELGSPEISQLQSGFGDPDAAFVSTHFVTDSPDGTWTGFCEECRPTRRIDHIFVQHIKIVEPSRALHQRFNGTWPSDHCPILGRFAL